MEEQLGKLTLTLTKRKTVKFSNFIYWAHFLQVFRLVSILPKALHKGRAWSARSPKLERQEFRSETGPPHYPSNDLFCLSFSPFFGRDTFALTSGF